MREITGNVTQDVNLLQAALARLYTQRVPQALKLNAKVGRGELLTAEEARFLRQIFAEVQEAARLAANLPKYQALVRQVSGLHGEIVHQALDNERELHVRLVAVSATDRINRDGPSRQGESRSNQEHVP